jgi:hypothetical protein
MDLLHFMPQLFYHLSEVDLIDFCVILVTGILHNNGFIKWT